MYGNQNEDRRIHKLCSRQEPGGNVFRGPRRWWTRSSTTRASPRWKRCRLRPASKALISLARTAGNYLKALQARTQPADDAAVQPELAAQMLLNHGAADEALALLDKALKSHGQDARLFYLKATAHAQKDEAEPAAEAIRQAVALNQDFLHQFRLERDFDRIRSSASFTTLGLE